MEARGGAVLLIAIRGAEGAVWSMMVVVVVVAREDRV